MRFDIITIFPKLIDAYFSEGVIARGRETGLLELTAHDLRDWTNDKHRTVDSRPFGGGPGMVMKVEPIYKVVNSIKSEIRNPKSETNPNDQNPKLKTQNSKLKTLLTSPRGKKFTQKKAQEYSRLDGLIIICGRYEGIDERVVEHIADEVVSIGDYVLSGGELAAMAIVEATARLIPGVLGNEESPQAALVPTYTRPEIFVDDNGNEWRVPPLLLEGNHKAIEEWRAKNTLGNDQ